MVGSWEEQNDEESSVSGGAAMMIGGNVELDEKQSRRNETKNDMS